MQHGWSEDEKREHDSVETLRAALPTSRHAEMLVESLISELGEMAVVETAGEGQLLGLYRQDRGQQDWIVPWPVLRFARGQRIGYVMGAVGPPSNAPPPGGGGPPSRLVGLTPGELQISDGDFQFTFTYGEDGRISETARAGSETRLEAFARAATEKAGNPVENLIDHVAAFDPGRLGSGRVQRPVPSPAGVQGPWHVGLGAVRDALLEGGVPEATRWIAVDGFAGTVLCPAAKREDALAACREGIQRVRPLPPVPEPPPELSPETLAEFSSGRGPFTISAPGLDVPAGVKPGPENTPTVLMELAAIPPELPPLGTWFRLLDERGASGLAALREDARGLTLVGAEALSRIDVATLDARLDAAEREADRWLGQLEERPWPSELPPLDSSIVRFAVEEDSHGSIKVSVRGVQRTHGFSGRMLRAEDLAQAVMRQRWEG